MTDPDWDQDVWDTDWDAGEPETLREQLRLHGRNLLIVVVLGGLLFLSGIYQGTLFHRTPEIIESGMPADETLEEIQIPLNITVFGSDGSRGSSRTQEDVVRLVANANALWAQGSITFIPDTIRFVSVDDNDIEYFIEYPTPLFEKFAGDNNSVINVFLLETLSGLNGIAFTGVRTVAVADFTTVRDYRTLAHEIGHILGLSHTSDRGELMYSGSNGTQLSGSEIKRAREQALLLGGTPLH